MPPSLGELHRASLVEVERAGGAWLHHPRLGFGIPLEFIGSVSEKPEAVERVMSRLAPEARARTFVRSFAANDAPATLTILIAAPLRQFDRNISLDAVRADLEPALGLDDPAEWRPPGGGGDVRTDGTVDGVPSRARFFLVDQEDGDRCPVIIQVVARDHPVMLRTAGEALPRL